MRRGPRVALCVAVLLFAAFEVARSLTRLDGVIFTGYTQVGEVLLQGGDPYGLSINTWPPFFLFVAAGLALAARVSLSGALLVWQVGSVLAIWGSVRLLARWFVPQLAGDPLRFWPHESSLSLTSSAIFVPVLLSARLIQEHLQHTQVNLFILLLCLVAFERFRRGRAASGGLALATAASLKTVPALLVGYLLFRRRWREAGWSAAFLIALNVLLPVAAFGPGRAAEHWDSWREVARQEVTDPTPGYANQSLLAALKRLLTVAGGGRDPVHYPIAAWSPRATQVAFVVTAGAGALALAIGFGPRRRPPLDSPRAAAEWAMCLAAMTIVSPLAWKAHYVTLLAAYVVAWTALRAPRAPPGSWRWALLWGSVACVTLSAPALVGERLNNALESVNVITVGAVMVVALALSGLRHAFEPVAGDARHA